MDVITKDVRALAKKELAAANRRFRMFASPHEGYAVIREELAQFIFAATEVQTLQKFKSLVEAIPAEMEKQRDIVVTIPDLPKKKRTPRKKAGKENERKTSG